MQPKQRSSRGLVIGAAVLALAAGAFVAVALGAFGHSFEDPATARCDAPHVTFSDPLVLVGHQQVLVHFTCAGARLTGNLYLPTGEGQHPAVVWVHGAGESTRLGYGAFIASLVRSGVAVFSYDKRGVGESQGTCCPGDHGHFNLLTADVVGAVSALRRRSDIDPEQIGLIGASQAGWIVPRAAVESHASFTALASPGILSYGQVKAYAQLTGGDGSDSPFPSKEEIAQRLEDAGPSGVDPKPFLERFSIPALWLFGTADREVPVDQSVALLDGLKGRGKDFTIVEFPGAGHGLLNSPPTDPDAPSTFVEWIVEKVHLASE